jgi:hypothetical protein
MVSGAKQPRPHFLLPRSINPHVHAGLGDHWTIAGMTGSGKTTFTKDLIWSLHRRFPQAHIYILDSKQAGDFTEFGAPIRAAAAPMPITGAGTRAEPLIQVWQPPIDDVGEYDVWFKRILKNRHPAIIIVDELSSIGGNSGRSYPVGYMQLLKQGRGLHISVITATQEAAYIPRQTFTQITHLVRFRLLNKHDGREIDRQLGRPDHQIGLNPAGKYAFLYRRLTDDSAAVPFYDKDRFFVGSH